MTAEKMPQNGKETVKFFPLQAAAGGYDIRVPAGCNRHAGPELYFGGLWAYFIRLSRDARRGIEEQMLWT